MADEKKRSFFKEFLDSWVGKLSLGILIVLIIASGLLHWEIFPFNNLSTYLSDDKYSYTFKMIEITVSILAFAALVWSISYQRNELLQSRRELETQSKDVNRSIDESNKNFDRELLLEFYRKIDKELSSGDLSFVRAIAHSGNPIPVIMDYNLELIQSPDIRIASLNYVREFNSYMNSIAEEVDPSKDRVADREWGANKEIKLKGRLKKNIPKIEQEVLFILHDMLRYSNNKDISFDEPVFSLLKSTLRSSQFFEVRKGGYKLTLDGVRGALTNVGIIDQSEKPCVFIGSGEFEEFLSALCELNVVKDINDFRDYILGVGEYS